MAVNSKRLKKITSGNVFIGGGVNLIYNSYTEVNPTDVALIADDQLQSLFLSNDVIFNDGVSDYSGQEGFDRFRNKRYTDELYVSNVCDSNAQRWALATTTTSSSTLSLTRTSNYLQVLVGSSSSQIVQLPNATTLKIGHSFEIVNKSLLPIGIVFYDSSPFYSIIANRHLKISLQDNTTSNGIWIATLLDVVDTGNINPDFTGMKSGFEDFLFDAYAGNGGNDNQYSFTVTANSGSSDIDGAVPAAGNDYEGIHILNSLTSATARPMVDAFNLVNRIKLRAQVEAFEMRVRIETLADNAQKFTTRYGLMDVNTAGFPANGVIFSYDPIYQVTAVAQIVTATPVVTSKEPTQLFTETINGTPYTYTFQTYQTLSVTWTRANNATYTVTINGTPCTYVSDSSATDTEISLGLSAAINAAVDGTVTAQTTGVKPFTITADTLGASFTYSNTANIVITNTTASAVATTVVSNLISTINADSGCAVTASGTTTLILTAKVAGVAFTYSGTANLTQVLTQPNVEPVSYSGNWIASVINSSSVTSLNTLVPVVAGTWYRLKVVCSADGTKAYFYINDTSVGSITVSLPSAALRYIFKLEKTLGTVSRTTSIDYITWKRIRE